VRFGVKSGSWILWRGRTRRNGASCMSRRWCMLGLGFPLLICRRADAVRTVESIYREGYRLLLVESILCESRCGLRRSRWALGCTSRSKAGPKISRKTPSISHAPVYAYVAVAVAPRSWFPEWCRWCSSCHCARSRPSAALKVSPWCS
jgi:hypothetical protein